MTQKRTEDTKRPIKIAYVTIGGADDVRQWSGLVFHIRKHLVEAGGIVTPIDRLRTSFSLVAKAYARLLRSRYHFSREHSIVASYSMQVEKRLAKIDADVVLSPGTLAIAHLKCRQPICIWTDATFAALEDFYPGYHNLCGRTRTHAHRNDHSAFTRCSLAMFSSEWAARSAVADYGAEPSSVKVVRFGANLSSTPSLAEVQVLREPQPQPPYRLLFVGVEWERKGGNVAVEAVEILNQRGIPAELDVIGCDLSTEVEQLPFVRCHGFLSKDKEEDAAKITELFSRAHLFILPTRADCVPVVLAEAAAYGLPSLATNIGGVSSAIENGANGFLFPPLANACEYATFANKILASPDTYRFMSRRSREIFDEKFNWGNCAKEALEHMKHYLSMSQRTPVLR